MADDADKTEEPSGKKLAEARNKGMVGKSMDLSSAIVLLAGACLIWLFADRLVDGLTRTMVESFRAIGNFESIPGQFTHIAKRGYLGILMLLAPVLGGVAAVALVVNVSQVGFLWTFEPLGPHFGKIFSLSGLARLFSPTSFIEIGKGVAKMAIVGWVAYDVVMDHYEEYLSLADMGVRQLARELFSVSVEVTIKSTVALFLLGVADLVWQKRKLNKDLRMSKQELKDEARSSEGDPHVKGKIKSLRLKMHQSMMMKELPKATVVITNPTFIAIAIRYEQGRDRAPVVLSKGKRLMAERIRDVAKANDIPIVEDKPLARGLYDIVEPGQEIPEEFFAAVAEILAYVYSLKGKRVA